jgi:crossover junction endodeoxyribonuclease RusA
LALVISLPWPDPALSPNARTHWRALTEHKATARTCARYLAIEAGAKAHTFPARPNVKVTFNPPDNRRRDMDNAIASNKAAQDGIADAIGVDDSRWRVFYAMGDPTPKGNVIVEVATECAS